MTSRLVGRIRWWFYRGKHRSKKPAPISVRYVGPEQWMLMMSNQHYRDRTAYRRQA